MMVRAVRSADIKVRQVTRDPAQIAITVVKINWMLALSENSGYCDHAKEINAKSGKRKRGEFSIIAKTANFGFRMASHPHGRINKAAAGAPMRVIEHNINREKKQDSQAWQGT